jgi:hypothetical protein
VRGPLIQGKDKLKYNYWRAIRMHTPITVSNRPPNEIPHKTKLDIRKKINPDPDPKKSNEWKAAPSTKMTTKMTTKHDTKKMTQKGNLKKTKTEQHHQIKTPRPRMTQWQKQQATPERHRINPKTTQTSEIPETKDQGPKKKRKISENRDPYQKIPGKRRKEETNI